MLKYILVSFAFVLLTPVSILAGDGKYIVPKDYFGLHFFYTAADLRWPGATPTRIPESVGSWRLWDAYGIEWRYLEPEKGVWRFEYLDKYVAQAKARGIDLVLTLGQTPQWASARPNEESSHGVGNAAEPAQLSDWIEYVRTVVSRYKGQIASYELWNEPAFLETDRIPSSSGKVGYYSGSTKSLVGLAREAAKVIHEIDPNARLITPSVVGHHQGLKRLDAYLKAGGGKYADIVGFHFYFVDTIEAEQLPIMVGKVRELMDRYGIGSKPLWNTESGLMIQANGEVVKAQEPGGKGVLSIVLEDRDAAALMSRYLILGLHSGLGRYYWFAWDSGSMGLLSGKKPRVINKAGRGFATTRRWLVGSEFNGCHEYDKGLWRCQLSDPQTQRKAEIAWSTSGKQNVSVSPGLTHYETLLGLRSDETGTLNKSVLVDATPMLMKSGSESWEPSIR